ncbi:MAG: Gfo/Idh/MocA family oxidoreductase [Actinobacteria bacterium]|nr:Gfo/Idh/MocA family oxidoreductase [Actinomycetota bacterium]
MAAIDAGKAVYCEWPLALDTGEALDLAGAATRAGVSTGVGLQGRWVPQMRHLRDLVASGHIGRPLSFDVVQALDRFEVTEARAWLHDEDQASGALFVASAHVVDSVRFVLGDVDSLGGLRATLHVEDRYADSGAAFRWTASDTVRYVARMTGGQIGSVAVSNITSPPLGYTLRIFGDEGRLEATAPGYYQFTPMTLAAARAAGRWLPSRFRPSSPQASTCRTVTPAPT